MILVLLKLEIDLYLCGSKMAITLSPDINIKIKAEKCLDIEVKNSQILQLNPKTGHTPVYTVITCGTVYKSKKAVSNRDRSFIVNAGTLLLNAFLEKTRNDKAFPTIPNGKRNCIETLYIVSKVLYFIISASRLYASVGPYVSFPFQIVELLCLPEMQYQLY